MLALTLLAGCAELMLVSSVVATAKVLTSDEAKWVETNRLTVAYPTPDVRASIEQVVERNGRRIVERDASSLSLRVTYPFSLLKNNWGGTIRITCAADASGTTITIEGDGRDAVTRVSEIGREVLGDLEQALRRLARTL